MATVLERFGSFSAGLRSAGLDDTVRHHARRAVIDWFAATLPGGVMPPATLVARALADQVGQGGATLLPAGTPAGGQAAALINGTAAHTVEFDDIYRDGLYHPGAPTIAAALAAAELAGADGDTLLAGVVAGYEVSNRIAAAVNPRHYDFWHTTATVGCFGAAAAASVILGLDERQTGHALATVTTMAAGLQQAFLADAMSKPLHSGRAAEAGLLAARLAAEGVTGALDALEGPRGFAAAMSRDTAIDWDAVTADLGADWTITRMTFKNHAACGHVHAAVDAVRALADELIVLKDGKVVDGQPGSALGRGPGGAYGRSGLRGGVPEGAVGPGRHRHPRRPPARAVRADPQGRPRQSADRRRPGRQIPRAGGAGAGGGPGGRAAGVPAGPGRRAPGRRPDGGRRPAGGCRIAPGFHTPVLPDFPSPTGDNGS